MAPSPVAVAAQDAQAIEPITIGIIVSSITCAAVLAGTGLSFSEFFSKDDDEETSDDEKVKRSDLSDLAQSAANYFENIPERTMPGFRESISQYLEEQPGYESRNPHLVAVRDDANDQVTLYAVAGKQEEADSQAHETVSRLNTLGEANVVQDHFGPSQDMTGYHFTDPVNTLDALELLGAYQVSKDTLTAYRPS